ncbi:MAG: FHA domain-containing protein [Gammaproteobacteria bacterium]|nr:FHA domain-containing protein [Gammaproteobacteria bacterium]
MRERDESIGPAGEADRDDGIPVLTEVEERDSRDVARDTVHGAAHRSGPGAARAASAPRPGFAASTADTEPTARIDASEDRIAALIAELATLRAATERMSARLAALEGTSREEQDVPVLVAAVWMIERMDAGEPRSAVLGLRTRIGRAADCEIVVDGPSVSRQHALIHLDREGAVLEDLNSTNGTFVNGRRILRVPLRDGDVVTLGDAKFRITGPEAPDATVA